MNDFLELTREDLRKKCWGNNRLGEGIKTSRNEAYLGETQNLEGKRNPKGQEESRRGCPRRT